MSEGEVALLLLLVVPLLWGAMYFGWRARERRQADVVALPEVPRVVGHELLRDTEATYVSTTTEGDWLDRMVARGLGVRSAAVLSASRAGLLVQRQGAPDLWVPAQAVEGVRLERGMAGKYVGSEGIVVVTWTLGDRRLDTGLRLRHEVNRQDVVRALRVLARATR